MNELAKNNPDKLVTIVEPLLKGLYADFQTKSGTDGQYQHCDYGFQSFLFDERYHERRYGSARKRWI